MNKDIPFGGIPFLGIGDFRQVAPVVKGTGVTPARLASVKSSPLWDAFHIMKLCAPIRSAQDALYTAFVDNVGEDHEHDRVALRARHGLGNPPGTPGMG